MKVVEQLSYDTGVWMLTIQIGDSVGGKLNVHVDNKVIFHHQWQHVIACIIHYIDICVLFGRFWRIFLDFLLLSLIRYMYMYVSFGSF